MLAKLQSDLSASTIELKLQANALSYELQRQISAERIELPSSASEAGVLPLNETEW